MKYCISCQHRYEGRSWRCPKCGVEPLQHNGLPVLAPHLLSANQSFNVSCYPRLAAIENGHFWFDSRNQLIVWLLARNFSVMDNLLEIGCGTGYVLANIKRCFPGMHLSGSDLFLEGLAYARRRVQTAEMFQMDACNVPFENEFSIIGAFDVLEHIENDQLALHMIYRALRPGGGCLISVPQHRWLWSQQDRIACHKRRYTRRELMNKMKTAGFRITQATSFLSLLLPFMLVSRIYKNIQHVQKMRNKQDIRGDINTNVEIEISPLLNRYFRMMCLLDNRLIKRGFSLPIGGSLFMAGTKDG